MNKRRLKFLMLTGAVATVPLVPAVTSSAVDVAPPERCRIDTTPTTEIETETTVIETETTVIETDTTLVETDTTIVETETTLVETDTTVYLDDQVEATPTNEVVTLPDGDAEATPTTEFVAAQVDVPVTGTNTFRSELGQNQHAQDVRADDTAKDYDIEIPKLNIAFTPFNVNGKGPCGTTYEFESDGTVKGKDKWTLFVNNLPAGWNCTATVTVVDSKGKTLTVKDVEIKRLKTDPPGPETTHMVNFTHPINSLDGGTLKVKLSCTAPPKK